MSMKWHMQLLAFFGFSTIAQLGRFTFMYFMPVEDSEQELYVKRQMRVKEVIDHLVHHQNYGLVERTCENERNTFEQLGPRQILDHAETLLETIQLDVSTGPILPNGVDLKTLGCLGKDSQYFEPPI